MAKRRRKPRRGSSRKWLGKPMTQATSSAAFSSDENGSGTTRGVPRRINERAAEAETPTGSATGSTGKHSRDKAPEPTPAAAHRAPEADTAPESTSAAAAAPAEKAEKATKAKKKSRKARKADHTKTPHRGPKEFVAAGVHKLKEAVDPSEDAELQKAAIENPDSEDAKRAPLWSRSKWLITVSAIIVGALVAVLAVHLNADDIPEDKLPSLTVGGATDAGRGFDYATMGSCLHWDIAESDGTLINFRRVNCDQPHRFEVAGVIDLDRYPNQRFDKKSDPLSPAQVESLRQGMCRPLVDSYLPKGLDPAGRFRGGLLDPDNSAWNKGVRTLVCGIEASIANSDNPVFTNRVAEQSQALTWSAGTCLSIIPNTQTPGRAVNCEQPHVIEVVGTFDLKEHFKDRMPTTRQQNAYSEKKCVEMANKYVGSPEKLRKSTLTPVWSRVSLAGWNAGSSTVNCYLTKSNKDGLAELQYSVKSPKLLIDGQKPPKVKPLPPKDNEQLPDMSNDPLLNNSVPSGF
ncbi:MAG TPA: septum formation family protein [Corynebacteriales bacterium]|nr:septum formation family protein [Mycobacteriales bacterium]